MPGFAGHTLANSLVLIGTTAFLIHEGASTPTVLAVDTGIVISTLVLSPDMDLFTSKPMEEWGLARFFWWPYAKLVKHRDRLHTPILGTTVRWLYLLVLLLLIYLAGRLFLDWLGLHVQLSLADPRRDLSHYLQYLVFMFVGGNIADAVHFLLDMSTHGLEHGTVHSHSHRPRMRYQHGARRF